jgi:adenosylcobinamide kinase / adenosylcobinamide-phosphate guanylyltransferase
MNQKQELSFHPSPSASGARLILVLGGARSGKSSFAEKLAASGHRSVAFIATATAGDEEMRARIARHQAVRPQAWHTLEEPLDLAGAVRRASTLADVLLLDCLTLWLSNWFIQQSGPDWDEQAPADLLFGERALKEIESLLRVVRSLPAHQALIVISNEVGWGLVPEYPLGRVYRDTLGYVNQHLARAAERVYLLAAGIAVDLKRLQEEAIL